MLLLLHRVHPSIDLAQVHAGDLAVHPSNFPQAVLESLHSRKFSDLILWVPNC